MAEQERWWVGSTLSFSGAAWCTNGPRFLKTVEKLLPRAGQNSPKNYLCSCRLLTPKLLTLFTNLKIGKKSAMRALHHPFFFISRLIFFLYFFQAPGLPYSEITWPSANPIPHPSRCAPPPTALPNQRSLDLPSECPPPCPAHPEGRHPLRRVKSTQVWRSANSRRQNSNICTRWAGLKVVIR